MHLLFCINMFIEYVDQQNLPIWKKQSSIKDALFQPE